MPGVYRYGINHLRKMLQPLVLKGLQSILLFGVSKHLKKVTFIRKFKKNLIIKNNFFKRIILEVMQIV